MNYIRIPPIDPAMKEVRGPFGGKIKRKKLKMSKGAIYGHSDKDYHSLHPHTHEPRIHFNVSIDPGHPPHGSSKSDSGAAQGIFSGLGSLFSSLFTTSA